MLGVNDSIVAARIDLLSELLSIGADLDRVERQQGRHPEIDAARRWQRALLSTVRAQLCGLMAADDIGTVH